MPWCDHQAFCDFINNSKDNLETLLTEFEPLIKNIKTDILFTSEFTGRDYNSRPGMLASAATSYGITPPFSKIRIDAFDVSSLCHELCHTVDAIGLTRSVNNTDSYYSNDEVLIPVMEYVRKQSKDVFEKLKEHDYIDFETSGEQFLYETDSDEIFACVLNDWYLRTHEPNIYASSQQPLLTECVVDYLFTHDEIYRNHVSNYCENLTGWQSPHLDSVLVTDFVHEDTWDTLADALNSLVINQQEFIHLGM